MRPFDPWNHLAILKDVAVLLISTGTAVWAWFRTRHAHSWLSPHGSVMSAQVRSSPDSYVRPWVGVLTYSYIVNGEYYAGFHLIRARSERQAENKIAGWKSRMVAVRYSPEKHDLSVLLKSDQPGTQLGN